MPLSSTGALIARSSRQKSAKRCAMQPGRSPNSTSCSVTTRGWTSTRSRSGWFHCIWKTVSYRANAVARWSCGSAWIVTPGNHRRSAWAGVPYTVTSMPLSIRFLTITMDTSVSPMALDVTNETRPKEPGGSDKGLVRLVIRSCVCSECAQPVECLGHLVHRQHVFPVTLLEPPGRQIGTADQHLAHTPARTPCASGATAHEER